MQRSLAARALLALIPMAIGALAACGTIRDATGLHEEAFNEHGPHVYGGVRLSAVDGAREASGHLPPMCLFYWLGMPLDLALDTLLLPWTIVRSLDAEEPDSVTVDRAGLSDAIQRARSSAEEVRLLYLGSEAGYHYLLISCDIYLVQPYRIAEGELRVETVFSYTIIRSKAVTLMRREDPWPQPEPLRDRFKDRLNR